MRKLLSETTKNMEASEAKELLLVLTKGRKDFTALDLVRSLMREADSSLTAEEMQMMLGEEESDMKKILRAVEDISERLAKLEKNK